MSRGKIASMVLLLCGAASIACSGFDLLRASAGREGSAPSATSVSAGVPPPAAKGTPIAATARHWNGTFKFDHDETVVGNACSVHVIDHLDGTVACAVNADGDLQSIQCIADGSARYSYDDELENGALYSKGLGQSKGGINANLEIDPSDEGLWSYIFGAGTTVKGTYDSVQSATSHFKGSEDHVMNAATDVTPFDPTTGVIVFDEELPLTKPGPIACPNTHSTGIHHFTLKLTASP